MGERQIFPSYSGRTWGRQDTNTNHLSQKEGYYAEVEASERADVNYSKPTMAGYED